MTVTVSVGDRLDSREQIAGIPVGGVMKEVHNPNMWQRCGENSWVQVTESLVDPAHPFTMPAAGLGQYSDGDFALGYNQVHWLPPKDWKPPIESLAQFQWRFRTNALRGACENGVGLRVVWSGLKNLGLSLDQWELGPDVPITTVDQMPEGTTAYVGDPERPESLGIFRMHNGTWQTIHQGRGLDYVLRIAYLPGSSVTETPAWLTTPGTDDDVTRIAEWKGVAWREGQKVRSHTTWCGAFEGILARVGVTAAAASRTNGISIGESVTPAQAMSLPPGSVFGWWAGDQFAIYRRLDADPPLNPAGTERVCGHRGDGPALGNFQRNGMRYIAHPSDERWDFQIGRLHTWVPLFPVGTFFSIGRESTLYHVARDGRIAYHDRYLVHPGGQYSPADFTNAQVNIRFFVETGATS